MQNLLLKIQYKFKKSYGGTPEPQTTQDAPWLHGPSLKNTNGTGNPCLTKFSKEGAEFISKFVSTRVSTAQ